MTEKISQLIEKVSQANQGKDSIFDVATAIEVCRQQVDTLDQAEELAIKSKQWGPLVSIYIENRKNPAKALQIIDEKINNLKQKVECLQLYAPKIFKTFKALNDREDHIVMGVQLPSNLMEKLINLVKFIVDALIEYKCNGRKFKS